MASFADTQILKKMPVVFTRQQLLRVTLSAGYSTSKASQILETERLAGRINRVGVGRYEKADQEK